MYMNKEIQKSNNTFEAPKTKTKAIGWQLLGSLGFFLLLLPVAVLNPMLLTKAGANFEGVFTAVVLLCSIGCIASACFFDRAIVILPSTGLCAYLVYSVILSEGIPWQGAMGAALIASIFSGLVVFFGGFGYIMKVLPESISRGLMAGLGLMLIYRGLVDGGIIINSPMGGTVLGNMAEPVAYLSLLGIIVTWMLISRGIKFSFAVGALSVIAAALFIGFIELPAAPFSLPEGLEYTVFQIDFGYMDRLILVTIGVFFIMTIQAMAVYEGIGAIKNTVLAGSSMKKGKPAKGARAAVGIMGVLCAILGAGPAAASEAGAAAESEGLDRKARFITGLFFLPLLFIGPLLRELVELQAFYVPALIFSGFMLFIAVYRNSSAKDWGIERFPEFLTLIMMPLTGDIISSLAFGVSAYILLCIVQRETHKIYPACIGVVIFFILMLFFAHGGVLPK